MKRVWKKTARPQFKGEGFYETDYKRKPKKKPHRHKLGRPKKIPGRPPNPNKPKPRLLKDGTPDNRAWRPDDGRFNNTSSLKGLTVMQVVIKHNESIRYKEGFNVSHKYTVGIPKWGNDDSDKNVYHRLDEAQRRFKKGMSDKFPEWIIITKSDCSILDPDVYDRVNTLKSNTYVAGIFGSKYIGENGDWFNLTPDRVANDTRGGYIQGNEDNKDWRLLTGGEFGDYNKDRWISTIIDGPILFVRGSYFMELDFVTMSNMAWNSGIWHWMADISLSCITSGHNVAVIRGLARQEDSIYKHIEEDGFKKDHSIFLAKWKSTFPINV